ncbi:IS110 family transposase [Streptococcus sobrinus]|uniref:IS110 family transposase n=1 Tax=Streptococcus sobrinus TaxID=1310 RepID=UPI001E56921B|nr:IS110 family transposase [Streptococcus sobrinus]
MVILYESCAGIDIHQAMIAVCVLHGPLTTTRPKREERRFDTTTAGLTACRDFLLSLKVQAVGMESTGVYWKPVWHALVNDFELILANPVHMKSIKGQKTDKKDAHWIAKLTRIGFLPKSFVPGETIQELRELTRQRKHQVETRNREVNRIHNILQSGGIKLTTYIEDIMGASGRNLMNLLVNGEVIAPTIIKSQEEGSATSVSFRRIFLRASSLYVRAIFRYLRFLHPTNEVLEKRIDIYLNQYDRQLDILDSIPGIDKVTASVFIAEVGIDMEQFPTPGHLASWAGLCPGNNESAGKKRSSKT